MANFEAGAFDLDTEFFKVGKGSLGGKARGLAFVGNLLQRVPDIHRRFESVRLFVPQTLVVTTEAFDAIVGENDLKRFATQQRAG